MNMSKTSNGEITIPLLPVQKAFLQSEDKFVAICSARAAGKTFVSVLLMLLRLLDGQNVVYFVQDLSAWRKGGEKHLKYFLKVMELESRWRWNGSTYTGYMQKVCKLPQQVYVRCAVVKDSCLVHVETEARKDDVTGTDLHFGICGDFFFRK